MNRKFLLILPPPFFEGNQGLSPRGDLPHQIVQLATCIKLTNHFEVEILDAFLKNISIKNLISYLQKETPYFIGIPLTITNRELPYNYIINFHDQLTKLFPNTTIILFNWFYAKNVADKLLLNKTFPTLKYLLFGDIEESLPILINKIIQKNSIHSVPGLIYRYNNKYYQTTKIHLIQDLDSLPIPDWTLLNIKDYKIMPHRHNSQTIYPMNISRGCNWNKCTFCQELFDISDNTRLKYRFRSPENVVKEILLAIKNYNINEIQFDNVQFPTDILWLKKFNLLIKKHHLKIKWSCLSRVNAFNFASLKILKDSGCYNILFGIESLNPKILHFLKKGHTKEQIKKTIDNCRKLNISITGSFLMGLPHESPFTILQYAFQAVNLGIDYFQIFITKWYANPPQTIINTGQLKNKWYFSKYDFYGPIFLPNKYINIFQLELTKLLAFIIFYFHPITITKFIMRIKSVSDFNKIIQGFIIILKMTFQDKPRTTTLKL